ncbi:hypothetical protein D3C72_227560 [compost metagenome]
MIPTSRRHVSLRALLAVSTVMVGSLAVSAPPAGAEQSTLADQREVALTVYNDDLGLVREVRAVSLEKGARELSFADVAAGIDPTSVSLRSLTAPRELSVLEQNYEYDLLTPHKLLDKYVGQVVEIHTPTNVSKAELLSTNEGQVYRIGDKIYLDPPGRVVLPKVPENLVARPTLVWGLQNDRAGEHRLDVSYLTRGLSWKANYVLVVDEKAAKANLNGWVTLSNQSGATYQNAKLTLVAGDVNRVRERFQEVARAPYAMAKAADAANQFEQQGLFEYHSYALNRATTLKDRQTKQLSLMAAADIPTRRQYVFDASRTPIWLQNRERQTEKVDVFLEFKNDKGSRLGMPLPKGIVRVYQADKAGQLQFVGEDAVDHTPKDEKVKIKLGQAFDLVGERTQTAYRVIGDRVAEASYQIKLRNHKDEAVTITALERMGGDWEITQKSHAFKKLDAQQVAFDVKVEPSKEAVITYTVRTRY